MTSNWFFLIKVTEWSDWSPCSASCGRGVKLRMRLLMVDPSLQKECSSQIELLQQRPCEVQSDCTFDMATAKSNARSISLGGESSTGRRTDFITLVCFLRFQSFAWKRLTQALAEDTFNGGPSNRTNWCAFRSGMVDAAETETTSLLMKSARKPVALWVNKIISSF